MDSKRALAVGTALATGAALYAAVASWFRRRQLREHNLVLGLWGYAKMKFKLRRGWDDLLVIADFDRTLTTAACGTSCHGVVESCAELSAAYRAATKKLFERYYPIETSAELSREQKIPLMQDWYRQAHELLLKEPFTPSLLDSAALRSNAELRPGCDALLDACRERGAPLVVCSAGLGNVVRSLFKHRLPPSSASAASLDELPIVSNWLRFDAAGHVCGFSEPLLHMFNKNGAFLRESLGAERWAALARGRRAVLLLGDGLGDAAMADGLEGVDVVKVGFLNETDAARIAARLPQYEAAFDAVLLGDGSFEWLLGLLRGLR